MKRAFNINKNNYTKKLSKILKGLQHISLTYMPEKVFKWITDSINYKYYKEKL